MSHPDYKHIGSPSIRLIEECGELIKAICKAERFGYGGFHSDTCGKTRTNLTDILDEIEDVRNAIEDFRVKWIKSADKSREGKG